MEAPSERRQFRRLLRASYPDGFLRVFEAQKLFFAALFALLFLRLDLVSRRLTSAIRREATESRWRQPSLPRQARSAISDRSGRGSCALLLSLQLVFCRLR